MTRMIRGAQERLSKKAFLSYIGPHHYLINGSSLALSPLELRLFSKRRNLEILMHKHNMVTRPQISSTVFRPK
jgi:hypothetical protein